MQRWGAKYWEDFNKPKVARARLMRLSQSDINAFPRFSVVPSNVLVVDSLCFFTGSNIEQICSELNSEYACWFFFNSVATLDNGGFQMRQQFIENIPLPKINQITKDIDTTIYNAFGFTSEEILFIRTTNDNRKSEILNDH